MVLQTCESRRVTGGESISLVVGHSDEMYILLSGQLGVSSEGDMLLGIVVPVAPVGRGGFDYGPTVLGQGKRSARQ